MKNVIGEKSSKKPSHTAYIKQMQAALTVAEVAMMWCVSESTVHYWLIEGKIHGMPPCKYRKIWLISSASVEAHKGESIFTRPGEYDVA